MGFHSSMGIFLKCPRAYFLRNVYKNEQGRKINIVKPRSLARASGTVRQWRAGGFQVDERFERPLEQAFEEAWGKVSGKRGAS